MVKQVIVMRKDLKMRKGKMIAQGAHASLKVILDMMSTYDPTKSPKPTDENYTVKLLMVDNDSPLDQWLSGSFTKICLYVNSEEELLNIYEDCKQHKLPVALITDSGRTEFNGVPTKTCLAIGPAEDSAIDLITGDLKLL